MESKKTSRVPWTPISVVCISCAGTLAGGCDAKKQALPPPPQPVSVVTVRPEPIALTIALPGRTSPYRIAEIRPQVGGIVQKRLFEEGSNVKEGDVLYQIDPAPFEAALENAKASLARSEANVPALRSRAERYRDLLVDKAVSQQDHDDATAALNQAEADVVYWKAAVETATINLTYTKVTAPISGRIGRSLVTDGALVTAHQVLPLAAVQQLDPIYVDVPQSTAELLRLKRRLKDGRLEQEEASWKDVRLVLEDETPYPAKGTLQFQDITVDPTTGSVILRAVFPNAERVLLPNMFVRAVIHEGVNKEAILIPHQAVARDPKGRPTVLVVGSGDAVEPRPREIVIDRALGDRWLVTSGLSPGDRVIVEGLQKVRPGVPVQVVPPESGTSS